MIRFRRFYGLHLTLLGFAVWLAGCAQLDPDAGMHQVQTTVSSRAGQTVLWQRDAKSRSEAARLTEQLLRQPIDVDDAARLALLNNANLQASFAELGIAEANAVQSSLLRNPFLHASVQTPRGQGTNALDFALSWDLLGLFTLPLRQDAAEHAKNVARLKAAMRTLELAASARSTWYSYLTARETADWLQELTEASDLIAEIARRIEAAGNQGGLVRANTEAANLESRYILEDAKARTEAALSQLLGLMGLSQVPSFPDTLPRLPDIDPAAPSRDELEAKHLDIALLKAELARAEKQIAGADRTAWTDGLELGWDWSRETDGAWQDGPSIGIRLPLFDTGVERRAAVGFEVERLQAALVARREGLQREAKLVESDMKRARSRVEHLRDTLLPLLSEAQDTALLEYNAMHRSAAQLLDLKRRELAAIQQLVQGLGAYWQARTAVEALHLGVSLRSLDAGRTASASGTDNITASTFDAGH
jgi:outer membrane protein TolC